MNETWYNQLGFFNNPFSIKPAAFHDELIGYEDLVNEILKKVELGEIIFLKGDYGIGKTTILKRIIHEYEGYKKIIYFSRNTTSKIIPFEKLLKGRNNFFARILGLKVKGAILLLDEIQDLKPQESEKIVRLYAGDYFKSVVLATKDSKNLKLSKELLGLLKGNIYDLKPLTSDEAVVLVRKRIGDIPILSDNLIKKIYKIDKNPRALLENCEDVCKEAVAKGKEKASDSELKILK